MISIRRIVEDLLNRKTNHQFQTGFPNIPLQVTRYKGRHKLIGF